MITYLCLNWQNMHFWFANGITLLFSSAIRKLWRLLSRPMVSSSHSLWVLDQGWILIHQAKSMLVPWVDVKSSITWRHKKIKTKNTYCQTFYFRILGYVRYWKKWKIANQYNHFSYHIIISHHLPAETPCNVLLLQHTHLITTRLWDSHMAGYWLEVLLITT